MSTISKVQEAMKKTDSSVGGTTYNFDHNSIENPAVHRKKIFEKVFRGADVDYRSMFINPGYRGFHFLPYPKHV